MNVPTGEPIERGTKVPKINPRQYIESLMDKDFDGYISITIKGETGLEEGTLVYQEGEIVSSDYLYFRYNKQYKAKDGLKRTLNAFNSRNGIIDTYKLSSHQTQLILTMNRDCKLMEPINKEKLDIPRKFTLEYEEELIEEETKQLTREQLMKKYGLTGLKESEDTGGQLIQKAREEHRTLEKFLEKEKTKK